MQLGQILIGIGDYGLPVILVILMWRFFVVQNKFFQKIITDQSTFLHDSLRELSSGITKMSRAMGKTLLGNEETFIVFRNIVSSHASRLIKEYALVLERNNLVKREEQIKKNLKVKVQQTCQDISAKLSLFNSPAGDLGEIFKENFCIDDYLPHMYNLFFNDSPKRIVLEDIKELHMHYFNKMEQVISDIMHNEESTENKEEN